MTEVRADLTLPALEFSIDGSYTSVLVNPKIRGNARQAVIEAARAGQDLDPEHARLVRVVEYTVPDREGSGTDELICLITTITDPRSAPAHLLAEAYHQRWEHETGNKQLKTYLRGPGRVLRSKSPDMVRQEGTVALAECEHGQPVQGRHQMASASSVKAAGSRSRG